jgi:hypothetical protein
VLQVEAFGGSTSMLAISLKSDGPLDEQMDTQELRKHPRRDLGGGYMVHSQYNSLYFMSENFHNKMLERNLAPCGERSF